MEVSVLQRVTPDRVVQRWNALTPTEQGKITAARVEAEREYQRISSGAGFLPGEWDEMGKSPPSAPDVEAAEPERA